MCGLIAVIIAARRLAVVAVSLLLSSRSNFGRHATGSPSELNQSFIHSPLTLQILIVGIACLSASILRDRLFAAVIVC